MKLRAFNKDKELKKLHLKRNKDVIISRGSIIVSVLILIVSIMYFAYARYESKRDFTLIDATVGDFKSGDYTIAAYVDNVKSRSIPAKDSGYYLQKVECEGGATGTWDSNNWELTVSNATTQTKCYVYFTTLIAESDQSGQYATLSKYYPVGSIYQTTTNDNPETLFGGCWEQIKDRFLLAKGDTYTTLGATGGVATNTLAANQIPTLTGISGSTSTDGEHQHTPIGGVLSVSGGSFHVDSFAAGNSPVSYFGRIDYFTSSAGNHSHTFSNGKYTNNNQQSVNNMPPYEVVNVYKRITCPSNN